MKTDITTRIYKKVFNAKPDHSNLNKNVKAVIVNFGDERGDIIVKNDNFGTRRKYMDFTKGKEAAGLSPFQIVFTDVKTAAMFKDKYIDKNDKVCVFGETY